MGSDKQVQAGVDLRVNSYIAVDLETTGLHSKTDKIIEIGAVKVVEGQIVDTYSSLIHPRRCLEKKIEQLTGITDQMLADAPGIETVIETVLEFCGTAPLLGHHIIFDYSFLKQAAVNHNLFFEKMGLDTLKLCRKFMPEGEKKNLVSACAWFQVETAAAHRALADAYAAHALYQKIRDQFGEENPEEFSSSSLIYKVKKEQSASKRQKDLLHDFTKYHRIGLTVDLEYLSRSEASRLMDQLISQYGRIKQ